MITAWQELRACEWRPVADEACAAWCVYALAAGIGNLGVAISTITTDHANGVVGAQPTIVALRIK